MYTYPPASCLLVLVPEVSHLFLHPLHSFLKFLDELRHVIVFVAEARCLTPVDLFHLSAVLVLSRWFWEPLGSLFVSEVYIAPVVETCTPVHGRLRGGCCRRRRRGWTCGGGGEGRGGCLACVTVRHSHIFSRYRRRRKSKRLKCAL